MSNHNDYEILDEQRALDRAEASTGLHDWGDYLSFRTGLRIFIQSVEEMHPSPEFRDTVAKRIQRILETRLHLVDDANQHPEIEQQKIERPIAIIGLPRTGTTITYDLITLDPAVRAPREFEMLLPWPASDAATFATDPRIAIIQAMNDNYLKHAPQLKEIQRLDCTLAGECNHGMTYHFAGSNFPAEFGVPRFTKWVIDEIPEGLYRTHKRLLQEFQWKGPKGRWVIKSPHHLFDLEGLVETYPCLLYTSGIHLAAALHGYARGLRPAQHHVALHRDKPGEGGVPRLSAALAAGRPAKFPRRVRGAEQVRAAPAGTLLHRAR